MVSRSVKPIGQPQPQMPEQQMELLNTVTVEQRERDRKKQNILIYGLSESTDTDPEKRKKADKESVTEVFKSISVDTNIFESYPIRFKRNANASGNNSRPAPVLVRLKNGFDRKVVLAAAKKLQSNARYKNIVYINPDLTESERLLAYQQRNELRKLNAEQSNDSTMRWGRRGDRLVQYRINNGQSSST